MYDNRFSKNVKFYECNFFVKFKDSRDSIVRLVTRLLVAAQPRVQIPAEARNSLLQNVQTSSRGISSLLC